MEGSHYLWAGLNAFADIATETAAFHSRFARIASEIGQVDKAYVFGTGPGLSGFVEGADLSDGLCIAAKSIVKNHDLLDRMKPRLIVAADPIFHAGCSRYAAAFRAALVVALERTGAWFLCPLRDALIYRTHLPVALRDRIVGIPFDAGMAPPVDLTETFALKPYPNVLTLMLLPLAASFARSIHLAGCDGRPLVVRPNCTRSRAYFAAASRQACAIPIAWAATPMRPPSSACIATRNPCPTGPSRFSVGTRQSSKAISVVSEARRPILRIDVPSRRPGVFRSIRNAVMPRCFCSWLVRAMTRKRSAN
jgi:hypothetical protein